MQDKPLHDSAIGQVCVTCVNQYSPAYRVNASTWKDVALYKFEINSWSKKVSSILCSLGKLGNYQSHFIVPQIESFEKWS